MSEARELTDWPRITITQQQADFNSLIDDQTRQFFDGCGGHLFGDMLLVQTLKELRALRAEVDRLRAAQ